MLPLADGRCVRTQARGVDTAAARELRALLEGRRDGMACEVTVADADVRKRDAWQPAPEQGYELQVSHDGKSARIEITALETMGIDPLHYVVFPRLVGVTLATMCLVVYFDVVAILFGYLAAQLTSSMSPGTYLTYIVDQVTISDLWVTGLKGMLFGIIIALLPSFHGLVVRGAPTDVPKATTRAVVECLALVFLTSAIVSVLFYY